MTETTSFIVKLCFLYQSEKINLLKDIDAAKFEKVNKVKLYILQIIFQRNIGCYIYQKKLTAPACFRFCLFVFFFYCAFMRKVLADFGLKSLALL